MIRAGWVKLGLTAGWMYEDGRNTTRMDEYQWLGLGHNLGWVELGWFGLVMVALRCVELGWVGLDFTDVWAYEDGRVTGRHWLRQKKKKMS